MKILNETMTAENKKIEIVKMLENLELPDSVVVTSASLIKIDTIKEALAQLFPNRQFNIIGVKAKSGVNEQPVGEETELGARNRIKDAEQILNGDSVPHAFVSIENGIFKNKEGEYEDKAVAVIKFPDGRIFSQVSPPGVLFPAEAVRMTLEKEGGFKDHTVGSTIAEIFETKGVKIDKQDPHSALTSNEFTRKEQIISAVEEALLSAVSK
jgi:non-canonical (house-cleaning) NTP pyrophosphatase